MKRVQLVSALVAMTILLSGCESMKSQKTATQAHAGKSGTSKASASAAPGHVWHMRKAEVQTMIGWDALPQWNIPAAPQKQVVALSMMVPVDWQFRGGAKPVQPNDCNFTTGRIGFVALSPDKTAGMISTPSTVSLWTNDRSILQEIQQDNQRFSQLQICKLEQPRPLAQKINELVRSLDTNLQVTGPMEQVPGVAEKLNAAVQQANQQLAQQGSHVDVELGRVPVRSSDRNDTGQGYVTVMQVVRADRLPNGATVWTIDYPLQVASFAPQGKYGSMDAMFSAMLESVQVDPEYQQACLQVSANIQSIKRQMKSRLSQIQAQMTMDNLNAMRQQQAIRQDVQNYASHVYSSVAANRSAAFEHSAQQFSMYMGDQALYHDPTSGGIVQLPSGSNHAWASQTGNTTEYILTDSPSFNPNGQIGSANWTEMAAVR